jgi:hypothetical protein
MGVVIEICIKYPSGNLEVMSLAYVRYNGLWYYRTALATINRRRTTGHGHGRLVLGIS